MEREETVWEKIYQDYQRSGQEWATLKDGLHPAFVQFVESQHFPRRKALDIGCGNGKYLHHLEAHGFDIVGIDSSPTAIEMAREILSPAANLIVADMYEYSIEGDSFDFVISHAALHHGRKSRVMSILSDIYNALDQGGKFFISLPSDSSKSNWTMMKNHEMLDDGTCIPLTGPESGLPHSFFSEEDINRSFGGYSKCEKIVDAKDGRWIIMGRK